MGSFVEESVEGYANFKARIEEKAKTKGAIVLVFSGTENSDGVSWCPDCVQFEKILPEVKNKLPDDSLLLHVKVGSREEWKSPESPFRTDPKLKLTSIPTVMLWGTPKRLSGYQIFNTGNFELLFED